MGENTFQDTPFKKLDFMCARPSLIERERERERKLVLGVSLSSLMMCKLDLLAELAMKY